MSMIKVDISKLNRGDIILSTSTSFQSKVIKFFTNSDISHAMVYVAHGSVMDSTGDGVQARNISKMFYDESCAIYVYRIKGGVTEEQVKSVLQYIRSETGAPYTVLGAVSSVVAPNLKGTGKQFCSRLVARAYQKAGINFAFNPDTCTPADIQRSPLLELVSDAVVSVTEEDIKLLETQGDTTVRYRAIESALLASLRDVRPSIRVLNDAYVVLQGEPSLDDVFSNIFKESGYLEYWKVERNRFPWRYGKQEMQDFYFLISNKEDLIEYCKETLVSDEKGDFSHWDVLLQGFEQLARETELHTFSLVRDLYANLVSGHKLRVESAKFLLGICGSK
ncbi:hypothetical protein WP8S17C03_07510 [Metapseudomonas otitidis]|uniref:Permuted papain-like amidase enzyme, YaeF/YiiX, C92 family n=1 Tax=Metapseudomonas otitidis TaxID=319939 RepID=A0A6S5RIE8_9GAMM|nr:YiiX/YebB-like N1pC/P60 family cysteine hydrolase [Pseudomonas otitidis]BBT14702.1 hypothetical protein WP8S17C03_07510 [Pseudomonas otitidis]